MLISQLVFQSNKPTLILLILLFKGFVALYNDFRFIAPKKNKSKTLNGAFSSPVVKMVPDD